MFDNNKTDSHSLAPFGYLIDEQGREIPITNEMVSRSMNDAKAHSIGTHTGINKVISDDMVAAYQRKQYST